MPESLWVEERGSSLYWLLLSLLILIVDQLTKNYMVLQFHLYETLAVFPGLNLTLAYNSGAAFSFLHDGGGWQRWFFVVLTSITVSFLIIWLRRTALSAKWTGFSLALIIGGALGNLWDRLLLGYVVDFIDFYVGSWHWPAFNVADAAICTGALILSVVIVFEKNDSTR